jgi:glutathione S-transferase
MVMVPLACVAVISAYVWRAGVKEEWRMVWAVVVTAVVLLMYLVMGGMVSRARQMFNVPAPAITGDPRFERIYRVHQNTAEQLILFLPSLWMFTFYVSDLWAGLLGLVFLAGRGVYAMSYFSDPGRRAPGFLLGLLACLTLLIGAVLGAIFGS